MTDHTTHFDDCGCLRAKLEAERDAFVVEAAEYHNEFVKVSAERDALRLRVAAMEAGVYGIIDTAREMDFRGDWMHQRSAIAKKAIGGDTTALRAMLVEAVYDTAKEWDDYGASDKTLRSWAETRVDRILGASKGGGE